MKEVNFELLKSGTVPCWQSVQYELDLFSRQVLFSEFMSNTFQQGALAGGMRPTG